MSKDDRYRVGNITNSAAAIGTGNTVYFNQASPGATISELSREARALERELSDRGESGPIVDQAREFRAAVEDAPTEPERVRSLWARLSGGLEALQIGANLAQIASLVVQLS
jgi:hypothetical protein